MILSFHLSIIPLENFFVSFSSVAKNGALVTILRSVVIPKCQDPRQFIREIVRATLDPSTVFTNLL